MIGNQDENNIGEKVHERVYASTVDYYKLEGKIFRHSKLFSNSYRQERNIFNKNIDSKQENSRPLTTVYDLGKQLLMHSRAGDSDKVHELMGRGAPFSTDWLGMSALHFAAINNNLKICDLLLRGGISKDGRTKVDRTPLHFAVYQGHESVVKLLLERKCDVNARDMLKMTPLHWAVEKGHKSVARMLLKYGANVSYVSKFNKTPICIALESGQLDLVDELKVAKEQQRLEKSLIDAVQVQVTVLNHNSETAKKDEEIKYAEPTIQPENISEDLQDAEASVLELLKNHGISMLPHDDPATSLISSALKSGRKFVLSEAGKLVLNETKLKHSKMSEKKIENRLEKLKPSVMSDVNKSVQRRDDQKSSVILKTKGLYVNPRKNVKVISVDTFKKMYGEKLINSLKRIRQEKAGKHCITKITKITRKNSNEASNEHKINKKELHEKPISENTSFQDIGEGELPPNIEICIDSESECDNMIHSPSDQHISSSQVNEHNLNLENKDTFLNNNNDDNFISNIKVYSNKSSNLISNKREVNQGKNELPRKCSISQPSLNMNKNENLIPVLDIPEICRQLYELRKEAEELKKCNQEYRRRIEKLENDLIK